MKNVRRKTQEGNKENNGIPDIIAASYRGDAAEVRRLIADGVDVNTVDPTDNLTPLHIACLNGDKELTKVILDRELSHGDVDFTIRSHYRGRLAWQLAMTAFHHEIGNMVDEAALRKQKPVASPSPSLG